MSQWIDVIKRSALAPTEHVLVDVDGVQVAVFNVNGEIYAIEDVCTHDGAEMASGQLDGDQLICPRHGARFCVKTGKAMTPPAYEPVECFSVRVEAEMIQVCSEW